MTAQSDDTPVYTIHPLHLGDVELDGSRMVITRQPGVPLRVPVYAFLVTGGPDPILVDSGFRDPAIMERLGMGGYQDETQRLAASLARHGLTPADIRWLFYTHLHIDHAGRTEDFPMTTTVIINRRELEYSVSGLSGGSYPPEDIKPLIDRLHTPGALGLLDVELTGTEEVLPGIVCRAAGAHTEGSMTITLPTADGRATICGDAFYNVHEQAVAPRTPLFGDPVTSNNFVVTRRSEKAAIKRILNNADVIYPSHDAPARIAHGRIVGRLPG